VVLRNPKKYFPGPSCLGAEQRLLGARSGIVSKQLDVSGPVWLKSKNPASEAVRLEREEEWR
jgi:hypothetical protein